MFQVLIIRETSIVFGAESVALQCCPVCDRADGGRRARIKRSSRSSGISLGPKSMHPTATTSSVIGSQMAPFEPRLATAANIARSFTALPGSALARTRDACEARHRQKW